MSQSGEEQSGRVSSDYTNRLSPSKCEEIEKSVVGKLKVQDTSKPPDEKMDSSSEESVRSASSIVKSKEENLTIDYSPEEEVKSKVPRYLGEAKKVAFAGEKYVSECEYKTHSKTLCLHDLYVHTFHPVFPELVVILSESGLAGDAKHKIGEALDLSIESVYLFGLFEHKMGFPTKHISDDVPVKNCKTVSFQRFSFDPQLEVDLTRHDIVCMELIYHEAMYKLENKLLYPHVPDLESQLCKGGSATNSISMMSVFLQRLRQKKLCYWLFYYRTDNCLLCSPFLVSDNTVIIGDFLHVAFDLRYCILINEKAGTINCYEWKQIRSVRMHPQNKFVTFEVEHQTRLNMISLYSELFYEYIFTVSIHLIKLHEAMVDRRSLFKNGPDLIGNHLVFFNDAFLQQGILKPAPTRMQHKLRVTREEVRHDDEELRVISYLDDIKGETKGATKSNPLAAACCSGNN